MENFFRWLGEQLGDGLRLVVEALTGAFASVDDFVTGLTAALGMNATLVNLVFLLVGIYLLYSGGRKLFRGAPLASVFRFGAAVLLLGWLID